MNASVIAGLVVTLVAGTAVIETRDELKLPLPVEEHQWLQQLAGEWDGEIEAQLEPGQPPRRSTATESVRLVGGFWVVTEMQGTCPVLGAPFTSSLTLGYDPDRDKFVGTWVDSMSSHLWRYEGTLDPARNVLTLETEGPCPLVPGKLSKFREVIELESKDHKVFTSSIQREDGQWVTLATCNSRRTR